MASMNEIIWTSWQQFGNFMDIKITQKYNIIIQQIKFGPPVWKFQSKPATSSAIPSIFLIQ